MAGSLMKGWTDAKAQAQKTLGKEGKLPKPRVDPETVMGEANKAILELVAVRDSMETKALAVENAAAKVVNTAKQYGAMIDSADFELDPKKPDDKKKIADAQKVLSASLEAIEDFGTKMQTILSTLDKSLASLEKQLADAK